MKKGYYILIAVIVLLVLGFFLWKGSGTDKEVSPTGTATNQEEQIPSLPFPQEEIPAEGKG